MRRPYLILALLILAWSAVSYRSLLDHPWSYDDYDHIEKARDVLASTSALFDPASKEPSRVVHHLYVLAVYLLFGESVHAFHFLNIVLHLLNAWLCYRISHRLFQGDERLALTAAALFALGTVGYEAVYWIAASATLLGTAFAQVAVLVSLRARNTSDAVVAAASLLASCLSYESHLPIVAVLLFLAWSRRDRIPLALPAGCVAAVLLFIAADSLVFDTQGHKVDANEIVLGGHVFTHIARFIGRLFVNPFVSPFGWSGAVPFDMPAHSFAFYTAAGALLTIGLVLLAIRSPAVAILLVWIAAAALPSSLSTDPRLFPRYWYLPSVPSSILTAMAVRWVIHRAHLPAPHRHAVEAVVLVLLLLVSAVKSRGYEGRYLVNTANFHKDHLDDANTAIRLYTRAEVDYSIRTGHLYRGLASAYLEIGDAEKAAETLATLAVTEPAYALETADLLAASGHPQMALDLLAALPAGWRAESMLAAAPIILASGDLKKARSLYAAGVKADSAAAYLGMGLIDFQNGKREDALLNLNRAVAAAPARPEARRGRAFILSGLGNHRQAAEDYAAVVSLDPSSAEAQFELGTVLLKAGDADRAITHLRKAVDLAPRHPDYLFNAAMAARTVGRNAEARRLFGILLSVSPDHPQADAVRFWLSRPDSPLDTPSAD